MARFFNVALLVAMAAVAVSAQFDFFGGYPGSDFQAVGQRDARDNRGPVTFPVTQGGSETSGVRVGASGYGFIPPGNRGGTKQILLPKNFINIGNKVQTAKPASLKDVEETFDEAMFDLIKAKEDAELEAHVKQKEADEEAKDAIQKAIAMMGVGPYGAGPSSFNGFHW